jgi:hypothetical protein
MPEWSVEEAQLFAGVSMLLVMGGALLAVVWLGFMQPVRKAKAALLQLGILLGLTPGVTRESLWRAHREQFSWTPWPTAKGWHGKFQVELTVQPGARWMSALTTLVVSGPRSVVGGRVLVSRQPEMMTFSKHALNPFSRPPAATDPATLQAFIGNAKVYYDSAELEPLLEEAVRALVLTLPRHWLTIGFMARRCCSPGGGWKPIPPSWNRPSRSPKRA